MITFTLTTPRFSMLYMFAGNKCFVPQEMLIFPGSLVDCILEAVFTVSPKKQYLGTLIPTTPATAGPLWIPETQNK